MLVKISVRTYSTFLALVTNYQFLVLSICLLLTFYLTYDIVLIFTAGIFGIQIGWGREYLGNGTNGTDQSPLSPVLREVKVPFVSDTDCRKANPDSNVFT